METMERFLAAGQSLIDHRLRSNELQVNLALRVSVSMTSRIESHLLLENLAFYQRNYWGLNLFTLRRPYLLTLLIYFIVCVTISPPLQVSNCDATTFKSAMVEIILSG
jgi:hypothetical protein